MNTQQQEHVAVFLNKPFFMEMPGEGAVLELFRNDLSNILSLSFNNIDPLELDAFDNAPIYCGLKTNTNGACMIYFEIGCLSFEQPFNIALLLEGGKTSHDKMSFNANEKERLLISAFLIDHDTNLVKSMRVFTLPLVVSQDLHRYIQKQFIIPSSKEAIDGANTEIMQSASSFDEAIKTVDMHLCGV
ncbi:hypothetical protein [Photobacterium sp. GB-72]|uniref:hypothetical protein n=1 Tax=Photobacterium sp. GB-72 TaxID=2022105 RepID=UPI000D1544AF|nr:hypothetical protein [Photobacterium sp. GB-72]PSV27617.1 hypothetical protein C9J40_19985 [Photobacterium sp. GB-72]